MSVIGAKRFPLSRIAASVLALAVALPAAGQEVAIEPPRGRDADNRAFAASFQDAANEAAVASELPYPARTIAEGTFIQAVLETAIDSSLPGPIRAAVMNDVRAFDGRAVIFPRGTRIIGTYRADLSIAQERALVVWTRAITPEGSSISLGSFGADRLGRSGVTGVVDTHFWERFGSAALISVLGVAPLVLVAESGASDETADLATDVGQDLRATSNSVLEEYLRIPPTIHVHQGDVVTIIAGRDLIVFDD